MKRICAICGKQHPSKVTIYSRFTRKHYCADIDACNRRAKRREKKLPPPSPERSRRLVPSAPLLASRGLV